MEREFDINQPIMQSSEPFVKSSEPFMKSSEPFMQSAAPFVKSAAPFVKSAAPFDTPTADDSEKGVKPCLYRTHVMEVKWVKLGEIVTRARKRCGNDEAVVSGIDINKEFISTRANLIGTDISQYYSVERDVFACNLMHIGRDEKIPIAFNASDKERVVTSAYYVFKLNDNVRETLLAEYINLFFHLPEFDRLTWFYTDSSIRGNLSESRFLDIKIPIPYKDGKPDVERQREAVAIWQGLCRLRDDNIALVEPLLNMCNAKMNELGHSVSLVSLGDYITLRDERNFDNAIPVSMVRGLATSKEVIKTKANMEGVSVASYKKFKPYDIAYVTDTSRRGDKVSLSFNQTEETFLVSSISIVFSVKEDNELDPTFLYLWFCRPEFDRYARFNSWGSAREAFPYSEMCRVRVPKPPIEVQRAIVDLYRCARRAKEIADEAEKQLRKICPAIMQYIIHS